MKMLSPSQTMRRALRTLLAFSLLEATHAIVSAAPTPSPAPCGWSMASTLPSQVYFEGVTSLGGAIYTFGGVTHDGESAAAYKFDGTNWTAIAPMPTALFSPSVVNDGVRIYVLGSDGNTSGIINFLYRYDPAANTYSRLASFVIKTRAQSAVYLNGKIYKFCGQNLDDNSAPTDELEIYNIATNSWTQGAFYPQSLSDVSAFVRGNYIYAAGGFEDSFSQSAKAYRYGPDNDYWDDTAFADLPLLRWGAAAGSYNGGGILAGGYMRISGKQDISASVIFWDPASNYWSHLPDMSAARAGMGGAILNGSFHVLGGYHGVPYVATNINEKLTCQTVPNPTPTPMPTPFPTPAQTLNISTRMRVETGNGVLIGGFIITGSGYKQVVVRGIGPSLIPLGIPGALADPIVELRDNNGTYLVSNNDWQDDPSQAEQIAALGLGLRDSYESGLLTSFVSSSSSYAITATLAGRNGGTGIGLLEIYDVSQEEDPQLANISTRGFVQTDDDIMIGGFILGRGSNITGIVIRGVGPSLAAFGVNPVLADPTIEVHDSNGSLLVSNDDW